MRKKRTFIFTKARHNLEVDYDNKAPMEIVPGYTLEIPDITYTVVQDTDLYIVIISTIMAMRKKKYKIKLVSFKFDNNYNCEITVKCNKEEFLAFCDTFIKLKKDDIENIQMEG